MSFAVQRYRLARGRQRWRRPSQLRQQAEHEGTESADEFPLQQVRRQRCSANEQALHNKPNNERPRSIDCGPPQQDGDQGQASVMVYVCVRAKGKGPAAHTVKPAHTLMSSSMSWPNSSLYRAAIRPRSRLRRVRRMRVYTLIFCPMLLPCTTGVAAPQGKGA